MNTCSTCKWWTPEAIINSEEGDCERVNREDALASAEFEDGVSAFLVTQPNFGCVQWEKKDDN